jgi:hypothetical protein
MLSEASYHKAGQIGLIRQVSLVGQISLTGQIGLAFL